MLKNSVKLTLRIFKLRNLEKYLHLNLSAVNMYAKLRSGFFIVCLFCFGHTTIKPDVITL